MYAFGDCEKNNSRAVIYVHDFLKKWIVCLARIVNECEFKKVLEHLYSYEYSKYFNYKKLKVKNIVNDEQTYNAANVNLSKSKAINDDDDFMANIELDLELNKEEVIEDIILEDDSNKKNCLENLFQDKDAQYFENLAFQDQRTNNMTRQEYIDYINCRIQTFISRGKKYFINFLCSLNSLISNFNLPNEFKDPSNAELVSFLLKEIIHKVITSAVKQKDAENRLLPLKFPLSVDDIADLFNFELDKLESFFLDYSSSIYLIKEFKKKKLTKEYNKNVKLKKVNGKLNLIVKKYVYLQDDEIDFLKRHKKSIEENSLNIIKSEFLLKKKRNINNNNNNNKIFTLQKNEFIKIFEINNYYTFFLFKDLIIKTSEDDFKVNLDLDKIKRLNKKFLLSKFSEWINKEDNQRNKIISEFKNFI